VCSLVFTLVNAPDCSSKRANIRNKLIAHSYFVCSPIRSRIRSWDLTCFVRTKCKHYTTTADAKWHMKVSNYLCRVDRVNWEDQYLITTPFSLSPSSHKFSFTDSSFTCFVGGLLLGVTSHLLEACVFEIYSPTLKRVRTLLLFQKIPLSLFLHLIPDATFQDVISLWLHEWNNVFLPFFEDLLFPFVWNVFLIFFSGLVEKVSLLPFILSDGVRE